MKLIRYSAFVLLLVVGIATTALAATTSGHAWGENIGWVDFSKVVVEDTALSGYAYGQNIGWISLNCSNTASCGTVQYAVTNTDGVLSGYAWGENIGWVDFGGATISPATGVFDGTLYSQNTGFIVTNCSVTASCGTVDYTVTTLWRSSVSTPMPPKTRVVGGSYRAPTVNPVVEVPSTPVVETPSTTFPSLPAITLRFGMNSVDVQILQKLLNQKGYGIATIGAGAPGKETTYFGTLTKSAVMKLQKAHALVADGIVGPLTRALLLNL